MGLTEERHPVITNVQTKSMALRSQLDAWDHRLPGTGHFDLKTRAVIAIRRDLSNYEVRTRVDCLIPNALVVLDLISRGSERDGIMTDVRIDAHRKTQDTRYAP